MLPTPSQTPGFRRLGGIDLFVPNSVFNGDGFYVSHNNRDRRDYGGETTALVSSGGEMTRFYILMGDHREAYGPLIAQGFNACLDYFKSHPELQHRYSDPLPA